MGESIERGKMSWLQDVFDQVTFEQLQLIAPSSKACGLISDLTEGPSGEEEGLSFSWEVGGYV